MFVVKCRFCRFLVTVKDYPAMCPRCHRVDTLLEKLWVTGRDRVPARWTKRDEIFMLILQHFRLVILPSHDDEDGA